MTRKRGNRIPRWLAVLMRMRRVLKYSALNNLNVYCRINLQPLLLTDSHYIVVLSLCSLSQTIYFFQVSIWYEVFFCTMVSYSLPYFLVAIQSSNGHTCPSLPSGHIQVLSAAPSALNPSLLHSAAKPFTSSGAESVIRAAVCCALGQKWPH